MSIRNLIFGVNSVTVTYLIRYENYKMRQMLLQNEAAIYYKMRQKFITKRVRFFITKCDNYYKMRRFYYKMRQLLQNATFITNCDSTAFSELILKK